MDWTSSKICFSLNNKTNNKINLNFTMEVVIIVIMEVKITLIINKKLNSYSKEDKW